MKNKIAILIIFWVTFFSFIAPNVTLKIDSNLINNKNYIINAWPTIPQLYADENPKEVKSNKDNKTLSKKSNPAPEGRGMLIKVMLVVLIIWLGLAFYLFRIDRRITKLEKDINEF